MDTAAVDVLLSEEQIQTRVRELAAAISKDYEGETVTLVCILKGAVVFLSDLMRALEIPARLDFMAISSYGSSAKSSGVVQILKDLDHPIEGEHVIIVEDIIDTGLSLQYLTENLRTRKPASLRVCVLLDKPDRRRVDVAVDYVGFSIPDEFVVGYGLDYAEQYRQLPYVGALRLEDQEGSQ